MNLRARSVLLESFGEATVEPLLLRRRPPLDERRRMSRPATLSAFSSPFHSPSPPSTSASASNQGSDVPFALRNGVAFRPIGSTATSFGFGGPSNGSMSALHAALPSPSAHALQQPFSSPLAGGASSAGKRRRTTPSDDEDSEAMDEGDEAVAARPTVRSIKRARRIATSDDAGAQSTIDLGKTLGASSPLRSTHEPSTDVFCTASLPKPALLEVFHTLLANNPSVAPLVAAALPPPSLPTTLATITALHRKVMAAIPTGAAFPAYVVSRTRTSIDEFVHEAKAAIATFSPVTSHPSDCFELLMHLTNAVLAALALLPSPATLQAHGIAPTSLSAHLVPALINAHHVLVSRVAREAAGEGKMLSAARIRSILDALDSACSDAHNHADALGDVVVRALDGVRERARRELGWLVGLRLPPPDPFTSAVPMPRYADSDEEL